MALPNPTAPAHPNTESKETHTLRQPMAGSGEGERTLLHSLDYPCTTRLRIRRLLAYHRRYSFGEIYDAAKERMRVVFDVRDLMKLVRLGQWRVASYYLLNFVHSQSRSYECNFLLVFLQDLMALNDFAEGNELVGRSLSDWFLSIYQKPVLEKYPCFSTLVSDVLFLRSDHARAFLKWQLVRNKAAQMVEEMAYKTPELKDRLHFPRGRNNLYHVVAIGSSFLRRRPVKNLGRKQSIDLARSYVQLKKRLPSTSQGESHGFSDGSARLRGEPLIALLEKALQAGRLSVLQQGHGPEYPSGEGFPIMRSHVYRPECFFLQDTSRRSAVMAHTTNSAMKRTCFQGPHQDTVPPGNDSKRPRTTGNFGKDLFSSFKAHHLPVPNQGTTSFPCKALKAQPGGGGL